MWGMTLMSNSKLVVYTRLAPRTFPHIYGVRTHGIDTIAIHCAACPCSVEALGSCFQKAYASQYGVGTDGRIGQYADENDATVCTSNKATDNRAITIEVACDSTYPYAVTNEAYAALIDLVTDICQRNNIGKLLWQADKSLIGQIDKQNMVAHRWFANKACPGEYLYSRFGDIANAVNARLEEDSVARYEKLSDIPDTWSSDKEPRSIIETLMNAGIICGDGSDPDGNDDVLDLSLDMIRLLVMNYRGGCYDKQLEAAGFDPVVGK